MPEQVRALRHAWPSQCASLDGLTSDLEQEFRFGQRVTRTEQGFFMGGTMKGGSSSMWYPSTREDYRAFRRWQDVEGLQEGRDDEAFENLMTLARTHGIEVVTCRKANSRRSRPDPEPYSGYGEIYREVHGILSALPEAHLRRPELKRIQFGGWGPDAAKASAYHDRTVMMYDFACRGARRTFLGLFLHELGHVHEVCLSEATKDALAEHYHVLAAHDAFVGIEFLVDGNTRKLYQKFVFNEFLAETYMIYASCGSALRETIREFPAQARDAWQGVYDVFRESFSGIEYE
ncbi:MAG: hypothetical protein R3F62_05995 [Planctomycetota bacterium]